MQISIYPCYPVWLQRPLEVTETRALNNCNYHDNGQEYYSR